MQGIKARALRAEQDLELMLEIAEEVRQSPDADLAQIETAKGLRRSIMSVSRQATEERLLVVRSRFQRLVAML
jgi:uncharacterized protein (UPF0254 family)